MNENMVSWHFGISVFTMTWRTVGRTDAQIHADTVLRRRLVDAVDEHYAATRLEEHHER